MGLPGARIRAVATPAEGKGLGPMARPGARARAKVWSIARAKARLGARESLAWGQGPRAKGSAFCGKG